VPAADAGVITTTDAARAIGSAIASNDLTFFVNIKFLSGIFLERVFKSFHQLD
jgi:hypothetical protein